MSITDIMYGTTEVLILDSHNKLEVCSALEFNHERHANMADLVKLRQKVSEVIFTVVIIILCLAGNSDLYPCILHMMRFRESYNLMSTNNLIILAMIVPQYVLRIPEVLLTSKNPNMQGSGRSSESFRRAPLWCCTMA